MTRQHEKIGVYFFFQFLLGQFPFCLFTTWTKVTFLVCLFDLIFVIPLQPFYSSNINHFFLSSKTSKHLNNLLLDHSRAGKLIFSQMLLQTLNSEMHSHEKTWLLIAIPTIIIILYIEYYPFVVFRVSNGIFPQIIS